MEIVGTLFDRAGTLFSKGFLYAGVVPTAVFLALNGILTAAIFPAWWSSVRPVFSSSFVDAVAASAAVVILVTLIGFVGWSLNGLLRGFIENALRIPGVAMLLEQSQARRHAALTRRIDALDSDHVDFSERAEEWIGKLRVVRDVGIAGGRSIPPEVLRKLDESHARLNRLRNRRAVVSFRAMRSYFDVLLDALGKYTAEEVRDGQAVLTPLGTHESLFNDLTVYAPTRVQTERLAVLADRRQRFPASRAEIGPTTLGNIARAHNDYSRRRYGLNVEEHWLVLQATIPKDSELDGIVEGAKTQLDTAVAFTVVIVVTTLVWTILTFLAADLWAFVTIGVSGGFGSAIAVQSCQSAQRAFTSAVRGALDLCRFDLLKALRMDLPTNSSDEMKIWGILSEELADEQASYSERTYKHT